MKQKKPSVRDRVIAFAKNKKMYTNNGWFAPSEFVAANTDIPAAQVHVVLGILKKRGILKHDKKKKVYFLNTPQLSPVNQNPEKPKLDPARENDARTINYLIEEQNRLEAEISLLDEKYDDALAVIRYLEDKLIKTIQYTARLEG